MKKSSSSILPVTQGGNSSSESSQTSSNANNSLFYLRVIVLLLLCLQNSGHALMTRYSQKTLKEKYSSTEVVLLSEILKLIFSSFIVINQKSEDSLPEGFRRLTSLLLHSEKMIILVVLYSVNNILSYVALGKVDAALYTVLSQLKILTTAGFMTFFFDRNLSWAKWRALLLLVLGCILVASPVYHRDEILQATTQEHKEAISNSIWHSIVGIVVVLIMVTNSGFASVYLESVLKKEKITVWDRNFQLALLSSVLIAGVIISERISNDQSLADPLFVGFTLNAYIIAAIQAFGGVLVAAALKYADSILKTLATCLAIVVTAGIENMFLGVPADIFVIIGCVATILAIANYSFDSE